VKCKKCKKVCSAGSFRHEGGDHCPACFWGWLHTAKQVPEGWEYQNEEGS
jgi:hypothetical protein